MGKGSWGDGASSSRVWAGKICNVGVSRKASGGRENPRGTLSHGWSGPKPKSHKKRNLLADNISPGFTVTRFDLQ